VARYHLQCNPNIRPLLEKQNGKSQSSVQSNVRTKKPRMGNQSLELKTDVHRHGQNSSHLGIRNRIEGLEGIEKRDRKASVSGAEEMHRCSIWYQ